MKAPKIAIAATSSHCPILIANDQQGSADKDGCDPMTTSRPRNIISFVGYEAKSKSADQKKV
eukprot:scaffold204173_cov19-Prasinocladus_malaysianus.AAC.1